MNKALLKKGIFFVLALFLLADLFYSYRQHHHATLDGDVVESVLPLSSIDEVNNDPFGIKTIINKKNHHNPNRFFCHSIFYHCFRAIPTVLQSVTNPIESIYHTCAISKILMQIGILLLLCIGIRGKIRVPLKDLLLISVLLTPLFQTNGWVRFIGIIDPAVSYAFFYALPTIFIMIYFLPLFFECYHKKPLQLIKPVKLLWIPLAVLVCFSGPLNPGIALIISCIAVIQVLWKNIKQQGNTIPFWTKIGVAIRQIPKDYYFYLLPVCILSFYSLYLGKYNTASPEVSLLSLYYLLPKGVLIELTKTPWFAVLGSVLLINFLIIKIKYKESFQSKMVTKAAWWCIIFCTLYILLLPLGGYRHYRPYIIRYDTFLPVTLCLFFFFGLSSYYLIHLLQKKIGYLFLLTAVILIFTYSDMDPGSHYCEKVCLLKIAESKEDIVKLPKKCTVMAWGFIEKPKESRDIGKLLYIWNITDKPKMFYQVDEMDFE